MRKINTKLLLGLLLATLFVTGAVFAIHHFQHDRIADSLLWQARRAEEQGQVRRQARYLQRYLEFQPKDLNEKTHLAKVWASDEFANSPRERNRAVRLLDDVLAKGDDQPELRRLLVKLALEVRQFKMARNHLEKLLTRDFLDEPPDPGEAEEQKLDAERGEAAGYAGQLLEAENQPAKALCCYRLAKQHAPQIESNFLNLALLLRKQNRLDPRQIKANQHEADQAIDELVKNNSLSSEAYLTRWRYRRDFGLITLQRAKPGEKANNQVTLKEAASDVEAALQRTPESVETLLVAADLERLEAQAALLGPASAEDMEKQRKEHRDKALEYIDQGLKLHEQRGRRLVVDLPLFRLLWHKANLLLDDLERLGLPADQRDSGPTSEQRQAWMTEVSQAIEQALRTRGSPAACDFLKARLLLLKRDWAQAVTLFEQVRPTLGGQAEIDGQINRYLGQCYEQLAEPGQMYKAYERLREHEPNSVAAQLGMAQAEWMLHHVDKAAEIFNRLVQTRQMPAKAWLDYARLELERQVQQGQLDWSEFQRLLNPAEKANPDAVEVPLLKAQWRMLRGDFEAARQILTEAQAEKIWKDSAELWTARISLELREKNDDRLPRARKLLDEAKRQLGDGVVLLRLAEARLLAEDNGKGTEQSITRLAADLDDRFKKEAEKAQLLSGLADVQLSLKNTKAARTLWQHVAKLPSRRGDLTLQMLLFDLSRKLEDEAGIRQAIESIRAVEGPQGPFHLLGEALCLIWQAEKLPADERPPLLDKARGNLDRVESLRPQWPPVYTARAQVETLADRKDQVRKNLLMAINLGETNPAVIREYVGLLLRDNPDDAANRREAARVLKKVSEPMMVNSELGRLAATVAADLNDMKRAKELLAKNLPDESSSDFRTLLWKGLLQEETHNAEAEKTLRTALKVGSREPEAYLVLVQYLVRQKREKDADAVLEQAQQQLPAELVELTLARCYEVLGRKESAQARYEEALNSHRQDAAVVRRVAGFYWNASKFAEAEPLLRDIVDKRVNNPSADDVNWARWHLALVLASGTDYGRFREALALVGLKLDTKGQLVRDAERERAESSDNRRFQARVLASQSGHRQFRQRAQDLLEELERNKALPPDDRFILAMLYESENAWTKARPLLGDLVGQKEPAPRHLAYYVQMLIEHKELREAAKQIERLETLEEQRGSEPNAFAAVELRARLLEEQKAGDKAIKILEDHIHRKKANPDEVLLVINSMRRQKKFAQAYARCLQAWKDKECSPEMVGGASVAVLRGMQANGAPASHEQVVSIEHHLNEALKAKPQSVVLMLHLAELYDQRGRWDEAENIYRRVLRPENEPKNIVALNNLAWLLAQRSSDPRKHEEALLRIEAAVAGIGRRADLLDTRGLVYLKLGQDAAALADFREAATDTPSPAHLYHLALAHYKNRDKPNASKVLKQAQDLGLQVSALHPSEQSEYQKMLMELKVR